MKFLVRLTIDGITHPDFLLNGDTAEQVALSVTNAMESRTFQTSKGDLTIPAEKLRSAIVLTVPWTDAAELRTSNDGEDSIW